MLYVDTFSHIYSITYFYFRRMTKMNRKKGHELSVKVISEELSQKFHRFFQAKTTTVLGSRCHESSSFFPRNLLKTTVQVQISVSKIRLLRRSACCVSILVPTSDVRWSWRSPPPRDALKNVQQCAHAGLQTGSGWRTSSRTENQPFPLRRR